MTDNSPNHDLLHTAQTIGVVLTSASALAYASGYFVLRARAHALGTDPGFTLVDQAYVFAGFRFAVNALIALLVIAPVLVLSRAIGRRVSRIGSRALRFALESFATLVLTALTFASFLTLEVSGILVRDRPLSSALDRAILGEGRLGVLVFLGATYAAAVSVLWTRARYLAVGPADTPTRILALIATLQLILLPWQHGVFFADRTARRLARVPAGVTDVSPPVWLLDRGADRASLIARSTAGKLTLITVKVDALDGIPVTRVAPITEVVGTGGAQ